MITMSSPFGSGFFGSGGFGSLLPSAKDVARKKALAAAAKKMHPAVAAKIVAASRTGDPALQKLAAQIGALNAQAKVARSAGNTTLANQIDTMTAGLQKKMAAIAATKAVAVKAAVAKAVPTPSAKSPVRPCARPCQTR